eukprot:jgi/Botrbrau1/3517/Bobra.341_2s0044.1
MSLTTVSEVVRTTDFLSEKRTSIQLTRFASQSEPRRSLDTKPQEPLLPPRFQPFHAYPKSLTADEAEGPLSQPDPPSLIALGKLLRYGGAGAVAIALMMAFVQQSYLQISMYMAVSLAVLGIVTLHLSTLLLGPLFGSPVYLLDIACFGPPQRLRLTIDAAVEAMRRSPAFNEKNVRFMEKIMLNSGLGPATGVTDAIMRMGKTGAKLETTLQDSLYETEWIMFDCVEALLKKTAMDPKEIDVVITSCSCFAPTPSMAAMILNKFKMRSDVLTYSLAGMGCSSSLICVDMAKHMLKAKPNCRILIVNHENITNCWYHGSDPHMLVVNCLFRMGGAAAILSNKPCDARRAKYELLHTVRTHIGNEDEAFLCMGNGQDIEGKEGVFLRKTVISVAGRGLRKNLRELAPKVLPLGELVKAFRNPKYVPDFKLAFDHFLLHTGGRGVLDSVEDELRLTKANMEPARETLYRFGNTSAASTWYILAYIEQNVGVKKGERFWQLGFGGGFKANSAVWRARRNVRQSHACWTPEWPAAGAEAFE